MGLLASTPRAVAAPTPLYGARSTGDEIRFGATVGAGSSWAPATPQSTVGVNFSGRVALTCSGLSYGGYLSTFDVNDWLNELKNQFISGAQAAAMSYLITTAYSNPTIASVLDMMNQNYNTKFSIFKEQCNAAEARQRGMEQGAKKMSDAQNQCYEAEVNGGASPTRAYQTCANQATMGSIAAALPAGKSVVDFLTSNTTLSITSEVKALLGLLPDERITASGYEMKPPVITLHAFDRNIEGRTANAMTQVLAGTSPSTIADCAVTDYFTPPAGPGDACIPPTVGNIVQSPAFLAARQMTPQGRQLYVDALSGQIAVATIQSALLDLRSQIRKMDVKPGGDTNGTDVTSRKKEIEEQILSLEEEVKGLANYQQAKANLSRTQLLAMDMVNNELNAVQRAAPPRPNRGFSFDIFKNLFAS
jgi:hypothetical protein